MTARHTFWIGPVPVVVSTDVAYSYRVSADGRISLDSEQKSDGTFTVAGVYDQANGWHGVKDATSRTSASNTRVDGNATANASIGTDATVWLYDSAGLKGDFAVFAKGRAALTSDPTDGAWELRGGFDLRTALQLRLRVFGVDLIRTDIPVVTAHDERVLVSHGTMPA